MKLPLLLKELSEDESCKGWDYISDAFHPKEVPSEALIDKMTALMEMKSIIEATLTHYHARATTEVLAGKEVDGFKLVKGRKTRKVFDETKAASMLHAQGIPVDDIFIEKLMGVPAMEKALKALGKSPKDIDTILGNFVETSLGEPTVSLK